MSLKQIISQVYRRLFNLIATVAPVKKHLVLFEAFNGKLPTDNPLSIYEALQKAHPDWRLVWGVKHRFIEQARQDFPQITFVSRFSAKWLTIAPVANFRWNIFT